MIPTIKSTLAALYTSRLTVSYIEKYKEKATTKFRRAVVEENIPCRLSYKRKTDGEGDELDQQVVIYCDPAVMIAPGAILTVEHCGQTVEYELSGAPAVYPHHQEVYATLYRERA